MKSRILLAMVLFLLARALAAQPEPAAVEDSVVAVVNDAVITRSRVMEAARPSLAALDERLSLEERESAVSNLIASALRKLVDDQLLLAEAKRLAKASNPFKNDIEERVKTKVEEERRKAGGEAALRDALKKEGLTFDQYVDELRNQLMRDAVVYQFVLRSASVSPAETQRFYREHISGFTEPAKVRYRQIFIAFKKYPSPDKARETAAFLLEQLKKQHDFAALAEKYSDGPRAKEGGLYDFQAQGSRQPAEIDTLLFTLPIGEPGGPVETTDGLYLFRVEERRQGRVRPFEEVQPEIERGLLAQKRMERYAELMARLERENYVEYIR